MSVWAAPADKVEELAAALSARAEVSHCYERECPENWPYNVFAMIHGATPEECQQVAADVSAATAVFDYQLLFSVQEFKKVSLSIF